MQHSNRKAKVIGPGALASLLGVAALACGSAASGQVQTPDGSSGENFVPPRGIAVGEPHPNAPGGLTGDGGLAMRLPCGYVLHEDDGGEGRDGVLTVKPMATAEEEAALAEQDAEIEKLVEQGLLGKPCGGEVDEMVVEGDAAGMTMPALGEDGADADEMIVEDEASLAAK
jgi:hypothetical protein